MSQVEHDTGEDCIYPDWKTVEGLSIYYPEDNVNLAFLLVEFGTQAQGALRLRAGKLDNTEVMECLNHDMEWTHGTCSRGRCCPLTQYDKEAEWCYYDDPQA